MGLDRRRVDHRDDCGGLGRVRVDAPTDATRDDCGRSRGWRLAQAQGGRLETLLTWLGAVRTPQSSPPEPPRCGSATRTPRTARAHLRRAAAWSTGPPAGTS